MKPGHERRNMMRARFVASVFSVIAALIVAVPLAHAGGASGTTLQLSTTTACRTLLNGGNAGQVMTLVAGSLTQDLQIGAPVLLCDITLTTGDLKKGADLLVPCTAPDTPLGCYTPDPNLVVCYAVSGPNNEKQPATITSPFGEQAVQVGGFGLVCVTSEIGP
jgi:hypothetical protein